MKIICINRIVAAWLLAAALLLLSAPCEAGPQEFSGLKVAEEQGVDVFGNGQPLTVRYTRVDISSFAAESALEFYDKGRLVEKYTAKGQSKSGWYYVGKAKLRDDRREEIVGMLIDGTGFFINDLFVVGADDQGRIVPLPVEIKTKKTGDILRLVADDRELRIPFASNPFSAALIFRWNAAAGKFILGDNFDQIPREPELNVPYVLTKDEGKALGGYTLYDRHWYREPGKTPAYNEATGEFIFQYDGTEVHAVRSGRNYYVINMIIIDGADSGTARGIKAGDSAQKVIEAYGSPLVSEFGDMLLYEYGCGSEPDRILRFAVDKSTMTVAYISLRATNVWQKVFPRGE
ncbi:MAG: hypothetical protein P4N41_14185 [Negativicutes bacterium]|nr:hypothetical protein [Negativicutes bacterium]